MQQHLPRLVDFLQQAENNRSFEGFLPIKELGRLHDVINSTEGEVSVKVHFGWKYDIRCLTGSVTTDLVLICQRCMQPMDTKINGQFCFALITDEDDITNLPGDMEPYIIEGDKQSLEDVVIDELLISIPLVTKHARSCSDYLKNQDEVANDDYRKPFASIKDLLG